MKAYSNGLAKPAAAGTIDLRDREVYDPHAVPSRAKLDLSSWPVEPARVQAVDVIAPMRKREEAFYEFQPSTIAASDLIWDNPKPRWRAASPIRANWWAAAIVGLAVICGILFNVVREGAVNSKPISPVQNKSAGPSEPSQAEKTSGSEKEVDPGKGGSAALPPTNNSHDQNQPQSDPGSGGTGGSGGSGGGGGVGGGSLDPAVNACVTIPGSTICQSASVDPLANDPIKVEGVVNL